jgi:folate-binding protein YgfZ
MKLEEIGSVFPSLNGIQTEFSSVETDIDAWQIQAIQSGQAWISQSTEHLFQPQELRLHQRDGVHFDKGCYLGQEIVARLWFKAKPKHWLHLIQGKDTSPAPAK